MTQEDKELLLIDLCARLPYSVKYLRESWNYEWDQEMSVVEVLEDIDKNGFINNTKVYNVEDIKPYLRPMSSMTEEEDDEWWKFSDKSYVVDSHAKSIDWLNAHHFDYRGLIEKGLALEAPKDMYK